jgi:hypothetical protein
MVGSEGTARGEFLCGTVLGRLLASDLEDESARMDLLVLWFETVFFFNFSVFDVMLQAISSPRAEGASPHFPRRGDAKKRSYTQLSCRYTRRLAVTYSVPQLNASSSSYRYMR